VILAGRRINDGMGKYIACAGPAQHPVVDIINALRAYGVEVDVHDPWVRAPRPSTNTASRPWPTRRMAPMTPSSSPWAHREFVALGATGIRAFGKADSVVYDVKYVFRAMRWTDAL
jgi:UDP-N-acetyl-D-galactosamine dehydrogenase